MRADFFCFTAFLLHFAFLTHFLLLGLHSFQKPIFTAKAGYVTAMDTRTIGVSIIKLKGGRSVPDEKLDLATGYSEFTQIGDYVDEKTPLAVVHYQDEAQFAAAKQDILQAVTISDEKPTFVSPILLTI